MIPTENLEIYSLLFSLETVLRELFIELFTEMVGSKWYKSRLPVDIKDKYVDGLKYEKSIKWNQLLPHHPIYYIDFPDLRKVIEREDNWREIFSSIFGRKDIVVATLSEIEFIRNKIAHNRICSQKDLAIFKSAHAKIFTAIGENRAVVLANRVTTATDICQRFRNLQDEAEACYAKCSIFEPLPGVTLWEKLSREWWFDEPYLNHPMDGISDYFELLQQYNRLERGRGRGHLIEAWVTSHELNTKYEVAQKEIDTILRSEV